MVLYHHESKSRGNDYTGEKLSRFIKEVEHIQSKWKKIIENPPCYNPNLTMKREDYSIEV